ncbi:NepR family anti-sigma factor [Sphingopyxis sp. PET50]|uniref:NepR family anti-sigma factor n=1 Tax=Sphingopyxis sp. PET50 TaxID=2976533 RepID=UPI0021B06C78|nr:NepR family anti-sigma factor [Sphingopyxis sp. PET50]
MKGNGASLRVAAERRPPVGSFTGTGGDEWHRALTGRQAPEPVSARLRTIYGNIVAEALPDDMLDLLSQLERKAPHRE